MKHIHIHITYNIHFEIHTPDYTFFPTILQIYLEVKKQRHDEHQHSLNSNHMQAFLDSNILRIRSSRGENYGIRMVATYGQPDRA